MERKEKPSGNGYYWFKYREPPNSNIQIVYVRFDSGKGVVPPHYHVVFVDFERPGVQRTNTIPSDQLARGFWWGPIEKPNG
jgi:hypothetical protein